MTHPRPPEFTSLRLLIDVGSLGSLGRAARAQAISQPAASKRLALLERQLGLRLVLRAAGGSELTSEGRIVADWAQRVLDTIDQLLVAAMSLRTEAGSDLHIAASMTIAEHLIPAWLYEMRLAHPDLHVGLEVANSEQVQMLVLDGSADIGFVEGPSVDSRLTSRQVAADRLAVVVAPAHPWAKITAPLRREQLLAGPLVVRESGSGTRLTLDHVLRDEHARPLLELGSNEAVKGAVIAGAGAAVLSVLTVATDVDAGRLIEVQVEDVDLGRKLVAVWPRGSKLSDSSSWLLSAAHVARRRRGATEARA